MSQTQTTKPTTWLQGIGAHFGKPAGELQADDVIVYNYGCTGRVVAVRDASPKFVEVVEVDENGTAYTQRLKKTRIVAIEGMGCIIRGR